MLSFLKIHNPFVRIDPCTKLLKTKYGNLQYAKLELEDSRFENKLFYRSFFSLTHTSPFKLSISFPKTIRKTTIEPSLTNSRL